MHVLGLGFKWAYCPIDGRFVLGEAATLAEGYEDGRDADVEIARAVADRPMVRKWYTEVSDDELAAVQRLLDEAQDYWVSCDYADDSENETDQWLGKLADAGLVHSYGVPEND